MPRGDRTGPLGRGPMTGRAAGYCTGYPVPGYMNPVPRLGRGYGRGLGRGFGRGYGRGFGRGRVYFPRYSYPVTNYNYRSYPVPRQSPPQQYGYQPDINQSGYPPTQSPEQDIAALQRYRETLESDKTELERELGEVEARIEELEDVVNRRSGQQTGP
ncbi:MAG: DUF5320 domain-containing protein [Thermoproteota archaeon]